ncbi:MAG: hypothetical protein E7523_01690 [Ruminococcaceae bacterium]|nr:hypothetical protein [Oscillospiraceae bacterium]
MTNAKRLTKKLLSCLLCLCLVLPLFSAALVPLAAELKSALTTDAAAAASTADMNTIKYASGGYHYFYHQSGALFVSEIGVETKSDWDAITNLANKLKDAGYYYPTDDDLNDGAGGDYIKFGFKSTTNPTLAYTKMAISSNLNGSVEDKTTWPAYYRFADSGTTYNVTWEKSNGTDLNKEAGGAYLYFVNTHDTRVGAPLTLVRADNRDDSADDPRYARYLDNSKVADMNQDADGNYIYLWMTDDPISGYAMHDNHATLNTTGSIDVSSVLQELQNTYNTYNDYLVSGRYTDATYNALNSALNTAQTILNDYNDFYSSAYTAAQITNAAVAVEAAAMELATTVTYNAVYNGGTVATTQEILLVGTDASGKFDYYTSNKATKEGWSFKGWNVDKDATTGNQSFTVGYHATVYAIFDKTVDIQFTYLTTAGTATSIRQQIVYHNNESEKTVTVPTLDDFKNITKKGDFTLLGFRDDNVPAAQTIELGSTITYNSATVNPSYRYYAVYSRDDMTLSFDAGHEDAIIPAGELTPMTESHYISAANKREEKPFTIPAGTPVREGYTFTGWAEQKGANASLQAGSTYSTSVDKVLYASWIPTPYTVTYDVNGGTELAPLQYDTENKKTKLATPKRLGYTFDGWVVQEGEGSWTVGDKYEAGQKLKGFQGDVTLQAQWIADTNVRYVVYHMLQTADGSDYEQYKSNIYRGTADSTVDISDMILTNVYGYAFAKSAANGVEFTSTTNLRPDGTLAINIYYDRVSFQVTLTDVEHATELGGRSYTYGTIAEIGAVCDPGYAVECWKDSEGNIISDLAGFELLVEKDIELTPVVVPQSYTITIVDGDVIEYNYGDEFAIADAVKGGYTFKNWTITVDESRENNWADIFADGTIAPGASFDSTFLFGNVTLTPVYEAIEYTITFDAGEGVAVAPIEYTIESSVTLPTTEKDGAVFVGWYAETAVGNWGTTYAGGQVVSGLYGDITLKAEYRDMVYTLTFDANGGNNVDTMIYNAAGVVFRPIDADAELPLPTRPGYEFAGWTCTSSRPSIENPDCTWSVGTVYAAGTSLDGQLGNASFEAKWTAKAFTLKVNTPTTVTYNGDETVKTGTNYNATISVAPGYELGSKVTVLIGGQPAYRANYEYACNADRSQATLKVFGSAIVGDVEITVTATPIEYSISYESVYPNHGFATTYTIESEDITIGAPSINGHVFAGWEGTGLTGAAADNMTIVIPKGSMGDRAYTATWNREYRVEFVNTGDTVIDSFKFMEGDTIVIPEPTKENSKFVHWTAEGWGVETLAPGSYTAENNDLRLTAVFDDSTTYTVETYEMNTKGEYELIDTVDIAGKFPGETASVTADPDDGFTLDAEKSVLEGEVVVNGGLTLKLYYARNQYTVTVDKDKNIASVDGEGTYYFEEKVTLIATANGGYEIVGWAGDKTAEGDTIEVEIGLADINLSVTSKAITYTITCMNGDELFETITYTADDTVIFKSLEGKEGYDLFWVLDVDEGNWTAGNYAPATEYNGMYGDIIVTAQLIARDDTAYTVEIYTQNIENDEYTLIDTIEKTGTTDTVVAAPEEIEGFALPVPSELTINGDGTTEVEYHYDRNIYTVTYKVLDDEDVDEYKYGAEIAAPEKPVVNGYIFRNWGDEETEIAEVMGAENLVYTATMERTPYILNYKGVHGEAIPAVKYYIDEQLNLPLLADDGYTVTWTLADAFGGWDAGSYIPGVVVPEGKYGDVTLVATYTPVSTKYTVKHYYEKLDGEFEERIEADHSGLTDSVVVAPYTVENYVTPEASTQTIAGDGSTVVEYYYYLAEHTVSYEVFDEVTTDTYKVGEEIVAPADPEVVGYEFDGWDPEIIDVMPNEDLSYKAVFTPIEYTITFDANGGSAVADVDYNIEDTVALPEAELADHYFVGWEVVNAEGNWTLADVIKGDVSAKYGDVSLKAVWSATQSTYTVETYFMDADGNYGEVASTETITGYVGDAAIYTAVDTEGYYLDTANSIVEAVIANDGSTVLKAYYARNKYNVTVTINGNGGQVISGIGEYYFGASVEAVISIADHYELASWDGIEADGTTVSFTMPMDDVAIEAVVTPVVYTFTIDMNDGNDAQVVEYTIEDTVTIPADVTRDAYTFDGWTLVKEVGNWTQDDIVAESVLTGKYGNVTIVANWTADTFTFAYDVNGGTMPNANYFNGTEYTAETAIVLPQPTKDGYRFAGWTVEVTGENNWKSAYGRGELVIGRGMYGNVVLTAAWDAVDVNVYVEHYLQDTWSDEYILISKNTLQYSAGDTIDIIAEAEKEESDIVKHAPDQFTFEKSYVNGSEEPVYEAVVAADGSTTIQLYYLLDEHNVTIKYETPEGVEAPETFNASFRFGQTYNIKSPVVVGYNPSSVTVSGTMGTEDVEATVRYEIASYKVTVNYIYANGATAAESVTETVAYGDAYSIVSPELVDKYGEPILGYTPSQAVVEGVMGNENIEIDVIYGINTYTLTIHYAYEDGAVAAEDYVADLEYGYAYNVKSAVVDGYAASSPYVSGTITSDTEITVTYAVKTYTVIFQDYDGTEISVQHVVYGGAATAPADPVREADENYIYEFKGWSGDFSKVTGDMVIVAEYITTDTSTGEVEGDDEPVDNSFLGRLKAFFQRLINFFKVLFFIT